MKRPKVSLENHKELYEFYQQHRQGQKSSKVLHSALSIAFKPRVHFADGAEQAIDQLFKAGRTVVLASNHIRAVDPCVIASLPIHQELFRPLLGNTFIPSKKSIQSIPVVRHLVDGLGAVPTFRQKDVKSKADESRLSGASRGLLKTAILRMEHGQHMAVFPEGERNKTDTSRIQDLQKGVGLMVCKVTDVEQPAIVPMAIHYDSSSVTSLRSPHVFVGSPSIEPFARGRDLLGWLPGQMQLCLNEVQTLSNTY